MVRMTESENNIVNLGRWFQYYAFDTIGIITVSSQPKKRQAQANWMMQMSQTFGFLESGHDVGDSIAALDDANSYATIVGLFPWFHTLTSKLFKWPMLMVPALASLVNMIDETVYSYQKDYEKTKLNEQGQQNFIAKLVSMQRDNAKLTTNEIKESGMANIFAGSDTTSITLSAILYELCAHLDVLEKLRVEFLEAKSQDRLSSPITFKEGNALPYFQAIINEALRLHSATGFTMPRIVPQGGTTISGYHFPAGVSALESS